MIREPTQHKTFRLNESSLKKLAAIQERLGPKASMADAIHECVAAYKLKRKARQP